MPPAPAQRDIVMGPPPVPLQARPAAKENAASAEDVASKYSRLKRKYYELSEKLKDVTDELHRSGERNVAIMEEKRKLLDRVIDLEDHRAGRARAPLATPPAALLPARARAAFVANLQDAAREAAREDAAGADPMYASRHAGPRVRRAEEDAARAAAAASATPHPVSAPVHREAEDALMAAASAGANGSARSGGGGGGGKGKKKGAKAAREKERERELGPPLAYTPLPAEREGREKKELGPPLSYTPLRQAPSPPAPARSPGPQPAVVSASGTRLRIKPPAPPPDVLPAQHQHQPQQPQEYRSPHHLHPPPPPPGPQDFAGHRSPSQGSPLSPPQGHPHAYAHGGPSPQGGHHAHPPALYRHDSGQTPPHPGHGNGNGNGAGSPSLAPSHSADALPRQTKPKRLKAHTVKSQVISVPTVPRDAKTGRPILPLNIGIHTVITLGMVCLREHFHTERYIFPVGYEVSRRYLSTVDPMAEVPYLCVIVDGGDGPKFKITPSDAPADIVIAGTATGAWSSVVKKANKIRHREHSNSVSGPDFFGLGANTIKHLIQELPNVDKLKNYVWQTFVEGGPLGGRHAPVVPALPEDYDPSAAAAEDGPSAVVGGMPRVVGERWAQPTVDNSTPPIQFTYDNPKGAAVGGARARAAARGAKHRKASAGAGAPGGPGAQQMEYAQLDDEREWKRRRADCAYTPDGAGAGAPERDERVRYAEYDAGPYRDEPPPPPPPPHMYERQQRHAPADDEYYREPPHRRSPPSPPSAAQRRSPPEHRGPSAGVPAGFASIMN